MHVQFRKSTGTIASLSVDADFSFSYVPRDGAFGADRSLPGYLALGDISMRIRSAAVCILNFGQIACMLSYSISQQSTPPLHGQMQSLVEPATAEIGPIR